MAKNITRHVQHIKSVDTTTITVDGQNVIVAKLPEWGDLKDGEIAVNYNDGYETISIRNNNNEVVAFPNINTVNTLIDEKAQAALTFDSTPTANSTNPVTSGGIKTALDEKQDKMLIVTATITGGDGTTYYNATLDKTHSEIVAAMQANKNVYIYVPSMFGGAYIQLTQITGNNSNAFFVVIGDELWYCHTSVDDDDNSCVIRRFDYITGIWYDTTNKIVKASDSAGNVNNVLTFDTTPTANSVNPVTSDGIKTYVDNGDKIQTLTTYQSSTPLAVGDTHDQALSKLSKIIDDNEIVTARALTDLNDTKQDEIEDLDVIRTGAALGATALQTETQLSKGTTTGSGNAVTDISVDNHQITLTKGATFLTEHQDLSAYADGAEYDSAEHLIYLKHGNTRLANPINAADFIKDGMVDTVTVTGGNLVITFNTDSGKEDIEILLSDIFDPSLYYTKEEIDEHELVTAAALTELHDTKADKVALNDLNTNKQDKLEFDDTPTAGSDNPVTSNGIKTYVDNANKITTLEEPTVSTPLAVGDTYDTAFGKLTKIIRDNEFTTAGALTELHETKQELLTFDSTPTANSTNPVTSGGIKEYVDDAIDATDDTLVIECSGDLEENKSEAIAGNTLTITNGVTAADIVEAHTEGKKIEIRHTFIQSGHVDSGELITCVITTTKSAIENDAVGVIGIGISTAPIMASLSRSDYRAGYILNATHDEQDSSNDSVIIGGYVEDHPVLSEIDYINRVANLIFSSDGMDGHEFKPTFRFYDTSNPNGGVVAYLSDLESITSMAEITYSDLVTARNNNNLKPGTWYRITDYVTTTTQADTQSANHPFDVIVFATSTNTLSEEARAIQHSGDTYFANSKLNAWNVWYCLDNDTSRFAWADDSVDEDVEENIKINGGTTPYFRYSAGDMIYENTKLYAWKSLDDIIRYSKIEEVESGILVYQFLVQGLDSAGMITSYTPYHKGTGPNARGVIYRLIDEFNNDIKYDFKNIQFKRTITDGQYDEQGTETWCYTLNVWHNNMCQDASIVGNTLPNDEGYVTGVYDNNFGYATAYDLYIEVVNTFAFELGDNVILSFDDNDGYYYGIYSNTIGNSFYNNTIGSSFCDNTIGNYLTSNTIGNNFRSNTIGNSFASNTIGNYSGSNTIGNNFASNTIGNYSGSNTIGNTFASNTIGNNFGSNTIGNNFGSNTIGNNFSSNTIGNYSGSNTIGNEFRYNTIGNNFQDNTIGNNFSSNTIGNDFGNNTIGTGTGSTATTIDYVRYIRVEDGVQYVNITTSATTSSSAYLQNITISQGIAGSSNSNKKTISHPTVGDTFKTTYQSANSNVVSV